MAAATERIEMYPSNRPQKLVRPVGFKTAALSVGFDGEGIRLLVSEESADGLVGREVQPGWASFPKTHTDNEYGSVISVSTPSGSRGTRSSGLTATFSRIELLPENEILVVASRCYRNADGTHEMNAKVYGLDGKPTREFLLGEGINHIQTDS